MSAGLVGSLTELRESGTRGIIFTVVEGEGVGAKALVESFGILGTCIKEAPEFAGRRRHAKRS